MFEEVVPRSEQLAYGGKISRAMQLLPPLEVCALNFFG
jgi:hypothetical protein